MSFVARSLRGNGGDTTDRQILDPWSSRTRTSRGTSSGGGSAVAGATGRRVCGGLASLDAGVEFSVQLVEPVPGDLAGPQALGIR